MHTTIDRAGRVIIPKALRDELGLTPGPVEISREGAGVRIVSVPGAGVKRKGGRLVIPAAQVLVDDETVRNLRDADQR